jgi:hypothetical protein
MKNTILSFGLFALIMTGLVAVACKKDEKKSKTAAEYKTEYCTCVGGDQMKAGECTNNYVAEIGSNSTLLTEVASLINQGCD